MDTKRTVVITGSSTGFGREAAQLLAKRGHNVFATMRDIGGRNRVHRDALLQFAQEQQLTLRVLELDVTDDESVSSAVEQVVAQAGRIDVLINNAGFANVGLTEGYTVSDFEAMFQTNFFGVVRVTRAALPHMRAQGSGLIIHVSSVAGRISGAYMAPYYCSKFALEALADCYRHELRPFHIDTVLVEPGPYPTAVFGKTMAPSDTSRSAAYGEHDYSYMVAEGFAGVLASPELRGAEDVAEIFAKIIDMPEGQRPARVLAGEMAEQLLAGYNASYEPLSDFLVERFGMYALLPASAQKAAG